MEDRSGGTLDPSIPQIYQAALARWGEPLGIEEARTRLGELVTAAEKGTITLIAPDRSRFGWAAIAPLQEVIEPLAELTEWPLTDARAKLGDLVAAAANGLESAPQILTRHRRPVAAVVSAVVVDGRQPFGERLDVEKVLRDGATVTLEFDPGVEGWADKDGEVVEVPEPPFYSAVARDHTGAEIGRGAGDTVAEALLRLARPRPIDPSLYSTETPF
jgi:prevent-host-death family protein